MIRKFGAATLLVLAGGHPAGAAEPVADVFGGFSAQPYSVYGYLGGVAAVNGNLSLDGFLARLSVGVGGYSYQTLPGVRQSVSQQMSDAMMGYHVLLDKTRLTAFAGVELQNFSNPDITAAIRGASLGAKGQLEIYSEISNRLFGFAFGSLSSNYRSYYTKAKVGYRITEDISFGPEGMAQGNTEFDQASVGGALGFKLLRADWYLSGGYLWDVRSRGGASSDASGLYGQIGVGMRF